MGATVSVDHYSDITLVYLQKALNAAETLAACLRDWATSCGVAMKHCHADNGRYAETDFMADGKIISFCGVNTLFKLAERRDTHNRYKIWLVRNFYIQ
jgi:hypothetical protein